MLLSRSPNNWNWVPSSNSVTDVLALTIFIYWLTCCETPVCSNRCEWWMPLRSKASLQEFRCALYHLSVSNSAVPLLIKRKERRDLRMSTYVILCLSALWSSIYILRNIADYASCSKVVTLSTHSKGCARFFCHDTGQLRWHLTSSQITSGKVPYCIPSHQTVAWQHRQLSCIFL